MKNNIYVNLALRRLDEIGSIIVFLIIISLVQYYFSSEYFLLKNIVEQFIYIKGYLLFKLIGYFYVIFIKIRILGAQNIKKIIFSIIFLLLIGYQIFEIDEVLSNLVNQARIERISGNHKITVAMLEIKANNLNP